MEARFIGLGSYACRLEITLCAGFASSHTVRGRPIVSNLSGDSNSGK